MKKSLIALTIVGALAAPVVAQAESAVAVAAKVYDKYASECLANARPAKWHESCAEANAASEVAVMLVKAGFKMEPGEESIMRAPLDKHSKALAIMKSGVK